MLLIIFPKFAGLIEELLKSLKQYSIPFTGLKIGQHQFGFDVDSTYFNEFEYSLVKKGLLKVNLV